MRRSQITIGCAMLGLMLGAVPCASACTRPMTMTELADHAADVLTVRIEQTQSRWAEHPRRIETDVTFVIEEALKGARTEGRRETIVVPGGTIGEWQMRLCCAPALTPGKTYVLFLLPEYRTYPSVGMARGVFEVAQDAAGEQRVVTPDGDAFAAIGADGLPVLARGKYVPKPKASQGVRVVDIPAGRALDHAMPYEDFKARLEPVLAKSTLHPAGAPLARRIVVDHAPTPLVSAARHEVDQTAARVRAQAVPEAPPREFDEEGSGL